MKITKSYEISDKQLEYIVQHFNKYKINKQIANVKYQFRINETILTVYNSNKLVINSDEIEYFEQLLNLETKNNFYWDNNFEYEIGSDETGTGDFFGGVVVCSTKIKKSDIEKLKQLQVNDSKKINDSKIIELAEKLIKFIDYKICAISAQQYNEMIQKVNNSNIIKAFLHNKALSNFDKTNSYICIDQFVNKEKYYEYLKKIKIDNLVKIDIFETKAESKYFSVAAASIIARWWLLQQIQELEKKFNISIPLGAWNKNIEFATKEIINKYSIETLKKVCKTHFKCFDDLKNLKN